MRAATMRAWQAPLGDPRNQGLNSAPLNSDNNNALNKQPEWHTGTVRWFDIRRRWGFFFFDHGTPNAQAFIHFTIVQESRIDENLLNPGVRVRFQVKPPAAQGKLPEVTRLELVL